MGSRGQSSRKGFTKTYRNTLAASESRIRNDKVETAFIIDRKGNILLKKSDGDAGKVEFDADQCALMKGAVLTHNHPSGSPLSTADVTLVVKHDLAAIRATSTNMDYELWKVRDVENKDDLPWEYYQAQKAVEQQLDKIFNKAENDYITSHISKREFRSICDDLNERVDNARREWLKSNAGKYGYRYSETRR